MSKERRYQGHEIRQILDLAIGQEDHPARSLPAVDGLTLLELQDVGREVGLVAGSAISLPRWAREQERRMEHISRRAVSLLALPGSRDD